VFFVSRFAASPPAERAGAKLPGAIDRARRARHSEPQTHLVSACPIRRGGCVGAILLIVPGQSQWQGVSAVK